MNEMTDEDARAEIERDRRRERRVVWQAALALGVVLAFVAVRLLLVGWGV